MSRIFCVFLYVRIFHKCGRKNPQFYTENKNNNTREFRIIAGNNNIARA